MPKRTQCSDILWHLEHKGGITAMEAATEYGITRLSARIFDLREAGIPIINIRHQTKDRRGKTVTYDEYRLDRANGKK